MIGVVNCEVYSRGGSFSRVGGCEFRALRRAWLERYCMHTAAVVVVWGRGSLWEVTAEVKHAPCACAFTPGQRAVRIGLPSRSSHVTFLWIQHAGALRSPEAFVPNRSCIVLLPQRPRMGQQ